MNNKIKFEIWDKDPLSSDRVGTHYLTFKESMNTEPRWANLYGPPLHADSEYADLMTKFGDKGSHYRGRFLYSIQSHPEENPKCGTRDLKFVFPKHPSPSTKTKNYELKVALYETIELPEMAQACIHIACGPYEAKSSVVKIENSRAVFNQYVNMPRITSTDAFEDIPDVILYLAKSEKVTDRICFKRLKASDLMDVNKKKWEIDNYLLEEDKAIDALDDEEFPGILQMRIKMYSRDPEDEFPSDLFKSPDEYYIEYCLQIHLYMGRNFPAADETGAADPFIIARCMGKKAKSKTKFETLNPGFFQTLEMVVSLPPLGDKNVI